MIELPPLPHHGLVTDTAKSLSNRNMMQFGAFWRQLVQFVGD